MHSLNSFLELAYCWSHKQSNQNTEFMTGLSQPAVIQWFQWFRKSCSRWLINHPEKIGGPGIVVEIDESLVAKAKYGRGREVEARWVFGGYCSDQKKGFLQFVDEKDSNTILPLIMTILLLDPSYILMVGLHMVVAKLLIYLLTLPISTLLSIPRNILLTLNPGHTPIMLRYIGVMPKRS